MGAPQGGSPDPSLLEVVRADPDANAPRLAVADALEAEGDDGVRAIIAGPAYTVLREMVLSTSSYAEDALTEASIRAARSPAADARGWSPELVEAVRAHYPRVDLAGAPA